MRKSINNGIYTEFSRDEHKITLLQALYRKNNARALEKFLDKAQGAYTSLI
jgi:hypothetical protein